MWNRLRYTLWAPAYDTIARLGGFDGARRLSIERLRLAPGDSVLIVGAGGTYRAVTLVKPAE